MTNAELNVRAFMTLIRHAERHLKSTPESYNERNEPDAKGQYRLATDIDTPFGAYQIEGKTFRGYLKDPKTRTTPINQDKVAIMIFKAFKKGRAYNLIKGDQLSNVETQKRTIQLISNILGTPSKPKGRDKQWPSLPGQAEEGLSINDAHFVFKNAISNELNKNSIIFTTIGNLDIK